MRVFGGFFTVHLWTGGRRWECLNLEWPQVDFRDEMITLRDKAGERTIPMFRLVRAVLQPIRKDIGRVFADWHRDTVAPHWFKEIAVSVGAKRSTDSMICGIRLRHIC